MPTTLVASAAIHCFDPYKRDCKHSAQPKDVGLDEWAYLEQNGWQRCEYNGRWICPECVQSRLPMREEDIVILKHSDGSGCYLDVVSLPDADKQLRAIVAVDLERGIYGSKDYRVPVGQTMYQHRRGVMGVYNRTDSFHLQHMVSQATKVGHSPRDDD
jgi:hypothetical protein